MAKSMIPDPLKRRHLVERELPAEQALAIAEASRGGRGFSREPSGGRVAGPGPAPG